MKTHFRCFWFMRNELSCQYDNFIQLIGPTALSCYVMPACTNGSVSLSLSLFSFPFLVFFLSILLSRSLHSSFFFPFTQSLHYSTNCKSSLPQATSEPLKSQTWTQIPTMTKNEFRFEWLQWSESWPLFTTNYRDSSDFGFEFHRWRLGF